MVLCKVFLLSLVFFLFCRMANFDNSDDFSSRGVSTSKNVSGLNEYASSLFDPTLTWDDVKWLKTVTKLPVIVKGVLTGKCSCYATARLL